MTEKNKLNPKQVIKEFDQRALERKSIAKVLSDRFALNINEHFDTECLNFIEKNFPDQLNSVIDVGIGMGRLAKYFIQKSNRLVGVDFSKNMLMIAKKYLMNNKKNITLIYNDATEIDFLPNYFDLGIISLVLKHNNDEKAIQIIKKLKKWCKKILFIEHISYKTNKTKISIMRTEAWYKKKFKDMKIIKKYQTKRNEDIVVFWILKK